jgi:hypothetical protein
MLGMNWDHGATASTVMLTFATALPVPLNAVTVYVSVDVTADGVPLIVPKLLSRLRPAGNAGLTV